METFYTCYFEVEKDYVVILQLHTSVTHLTFSHPSAVKGKAKSPLLLHFTLVQGAGFIQHRTCSLLFHIKV